MMKRETCVDGLSIEMLARMGEVLRVLAHRHRLKIVEILEGSKGLPVHTISEQLELPHAATSQHLNHMRRVGILSAQRNGKEVNYAIADERSLSILKCIRSKASGGSIQGNDK